MPGWILVANRFSLLPITCRNGRLLSGIASLACLVIVAGCSNMRQQSLDVELPILPSKAAMAAQSAEKETDLSSLTTSDSVEEVSTDSSSGKDASALDQAAFSNNFAASEFEQSSSVQNFLPSDNDFKPQQPRARFVGVLDKAEMAEIKLSATTQEAAPAPSITNGPLVTNVSHESDLKNCETPAACNANTPAQCACCEKKELPKLAVVEPVDPEKLPELFGLGQNTTGSKVTAPFQSSLRPLTATNGASAPIRLTARQDLETIESSKDSENDDADVAENKAQMLIPIAPAALQAFKAEVNQIKTQEARAVAAAQAIKVSPVMDIESVPAKSSFVGPTKVTNANLASASDADPSKFIPVSSSGIRVSAIPFQSLPIPPTKPVISAAEPITELKPTPIADPTPELSPVKIAESIEIVEPLEVIELVEDSKLDPVPSNDFSPLLSEAQPSQTPLVEQPVAEQLVDQDTGSFQIDPEAIEAMDDQLNEFVASSSIDIDPLADPAPLADVDQLADLNGLPDMSQIEKELAEFEKSNTFDPSTVIESDRIDPTALLAKLDGPPRLIAAPAPVVAKASPNNDLITQQLAAQSSTLLELQDAIKQLKVKPAPVIPTPPELTLRNAAFCTKISGFGQFKPFAANNFSGSQKTLLYCEVENQTSNQFTNFDGSSQFETVLHGSLVIYDASDNIVQTANFPAIKDVARHQRRDFYVYFPVQFDNLVRGDYRLELSVEDASANQTAVLRPFMRFSVR